MKCEDLDTCNGGPVHESCVDFNYNENTREFSDLFE